MCDLPFQLVCNNYITKPPLLLSLSLLRTHMAPLPVEKEYHILYVPLTYIHGSNGNILKQN
uniref:Putative ovule protein n=1 Tax=Solanum chacoense TaxID=4108 RepID=A0A0V0GVJ8_SOLCH